MEKRGYLQISFSWLFAIIVGVFILFLAIYAVVKLINTDQTIVDLKAGKNFFVLTNPLETGFETGKVNTITFPVLTRIYNRQDYSGTFGRQLIKISQISFKKWTDTEEEVSSVNKYFFSESPAEGKEFYLFSKPFEFPFKVADLIYIIPSEKAYCFKNAPEEIKEEINALDVKFIYSENCPEKSVDVCFASGNDCEISVGNNKVIHNGKIMYFYGNALMYGAIFSGENVYEGQVKRLMMRANQLASLYQDKSGFIANTGCSSNLNLAGLISQTKNFDNSMDLNSISSIVEDLEYKNKIAICKLW